jgi:hypothetical protein
MRNVSFLLVVALFFSSSLTAQLPKINSFAPTSGAQGTKIKIEGTNLNAPTNVTVGGVKASIVNKDSIGGKFIEIVINEGPSGHVAVFNASGSDSLSGFTYVGPRIFSFTPQSVKQGDTVNIKGINFTGTTSIIFTYTSAKSFIVKSDTLISAVVGNSISGRITVTTSKGTGTSKSDLSYYGVYINGISPKIGSNGSKVTIWGYNLQDVNTVKIGNIRAKTFSSDIYGAKITATVDTGASGPIKIFSLKDSASIDSFIYVKNPTPKITSFTPQSAKINDVIKIEGENLFDVSGVYLGGALASIETRDTIRGRFIFVRVNNSTSGYVKVITQFGLDSLGGFNYKSPEILSFSPSSGISRTQIKINGKNFLNTYDVTIGGIKAESFTIISDSVLNVVVGGGGTGKIIVRSLNEYGVSRSDFNFLGPVINSYFPRTGYVGTIITILGSRFSGIKSVRFGGVNAESFTVDSNSVIKAKLGSGATGSVSVETAEGTTYVTGFVYSRPIPSIYNNGDTILCPGQSVKLTSSLTKGNQWFKNGVKMIGDTSASIVVSASANYTVSEISNDSVVATSRAQSVLVLEGKATFSINDSVQCQKDNRFVFVNTTKYNRPFQKSISNWTIVDNGNTLLSSAKDSLSYYFNKPGTYSVTLISKAENYGCLDTISKKVSVLASPVIAKPQIIGFLSDTTVCFTDTLKFSAKEKYPKFYWSTGDTSESINVFQSGQYYLRVGEKGNACYSEPSVKITAIKNLNSIPAIVRVADDLISSNANHYRWYQNNSRQFHDTLNTFRIKTKGIYHVATSRDKQCWTMSKEYLVQFDPVIQGQNEIQISAFPNPSNGLFFTQIKLTKNYSGFINIIISDLSATQTWTVKRYMFNDDQIRIPINMNLKKGSYTLSINVNGYRQKSIQFVVL